MADGITSRVFDDPVELEPYWVEWDELAVASSQPFAAPAWAMSWWSHMRPEGARLHVVLVWKERLLVGVAALFSSGRRYFPLGKGAAAVEPLARQGFEQGVAEQSAIRLAEARPAPSSIELSLSGASADWVGLLRSSWPEGRRVRCWAMPATPVPRVELDAGFDAWVSSRSRKFRQELRNKQRRIENAGGIFRYATGESLAHDVRAFLDLHRDRRADRGGTSLTDQGIEKMLIAAGSELLDSGRFRLLCLDLDGKPIAARVLLTAGREVSMWNSGFDESFAKLSPSVQSLVRAVADVAAEKDELGINLGPGGQAYKYRLSNEEEILASYVLLLSGIRYPLARTRVAVEQLRHALSGRLSATAKRRLRRVLRRAG